VATIGGLVWAAGHLLLTRCDGLVSAAACAVVASVGLAVFWPALMAWTGATSDEGSIHRRLSAFNLTWGVSICLAPYPAGALFEWSPRAPFYLTAVGGAVAAGLAWMLPARGADDHAGAPPGATPGGTRAERYLAVGWLATLVSYALLGVHRDILPKFAEGAGLGADSLGALMTVRYGAQALMFHLCGRWTGWRFSHRWLLWPQALALATFLVLPVATTPVGLALIYLVCGAFSGLVYFASLYHSVLSPAHRDRRAGFHEAMVGVGNFVGPALTGAVAEASGLASALRAVPLLLSPLVVAQGVLALRRRRGAEATPGDGSAG
jgi:hypothetical protein